MNEKMKELIAGAVARGWCSPENSHKEMDAVLAQAIGQEVEKLAELIVRECIDTAFHKGHPDLEFLLKHFGVEE